MEISTRPQYDRLRASKHCPIHQQGGPPLRALGLRVGVWLAWGEEEAQQCPRGVSPV